MKRLIIAAAVLMSTACSVGSVSFDDLALDHTKRESIGIPVLAGAVGSSTPITPHLSVTALHVARLMAPERITRAFEKCDIAFIAEDNSDIAPEDFPVMANPDFRPVKMYGYSANTAQPVSGEGPVVGIGRYNDCQIYRSKAGAVQGMSGGAVFQDGNLVGIVVAINIKTGESYFVGMDSIRRWLATQ